MSIDLKELNQRVDTTFDLFDLFGVNPHARIKEYRIDLHPDRFVGRPDDAVLADDIRKKVDVLYEEYGKPAQVLKSPKRKYHLIRRIAIGDISDVFHASTEESDYKYIIKVSRVPDGVKLLKIENDNIKKYLQSSGMTSFSKLIPTICESFPIKDGFQKQVNVFTYKPNYFTLEKIHEIYPRLPAVHIGWIFKRLLSVIGMAHRAGVIHGCVTPDHVMVDPIGHGIILIGWGQSVNNGDKITVGSSKYKNSYPDEVIKKTSVGPGTDIYMSALMMSSLGQTNNVDTPDKLKRFLNSLQLPGLRMRPSNAWEIHDEFDLCLRECFGSPKYHALEI